MDQNGQFYSTTKIYGYIKKNEISESYLFWLGLLNSQLFWFYIQQTGYVLRGGYYTFKTNYVAPFPVPSQIPIRLVQKVEKLVLEILEKREKNNEVNTLMQEKLIDNLIYEIYNLDDTEIKCIRS